MCVGTLYSVLTVLLDIGPGPGMPRGRLRPASLLPEVLPHQHQRPTDYLR